MILWVFFLLLSCQTLAQHFVVQTGKIVLNR